MRDDAPRADNGLGYLSESLVCSRAIAHSVLNRSMEGEEVQGT